MATGVTFGCDLAYGPGDNPYAHWARCLAPRPRQDAPLPPCDGRRLRRRPCGGEVEAIPLVVLLTGELGSPEREAARRALHSRMEAGDLRMDAHEHALLREHDAPGLKPPEREVYCLYRLADSGPLSEGLVVVEQGAPVDIPCEPLRTVPRATPSHVLEIGAAPVMGVIDDGLAFLNARFRRADGRTRLDALWMQGYRTFPGFEAREGWPLGGPPCSGFGARGATHAGAILERGDIDHLLARGEALDEAAVYRRLSRAVNDDPDAQHALERLGAHGTHVADLAAGADPLLVGEPDVRAWPILGVQLPPEAVSDTAGQHLQFLAIAGVRWILHRARGLGTGPVVITISFGALAGPKDGSRPVEWAIADELARFEARERRPARVNWAFGNARLNDQVARFKPGVASGPIDWRLQPDDRAASFLEIRPDEPERVGELSLRIELPGGRVETLHAPEPERPLTLEIDGRPALRLYRAPVPAAAWAPSEPAHLVLAAAPTAPALGREPRAPSGVYGITLGWRGRPGGVRFEVQRGDTPVGHPAYGRQSYLDHPLAYSYEEETEAATSPTASPITRAGTHSANADPKDARVWTTGAARPGRGEKTPRPTRYAAAGRRRSPVLGPTVTALAERGAALGGLHASGTLSGSVRASGGSSAAAPRASRALALMLAGRQAPTAGEPDKDQEAREVAKRWGAKTDPHREKLEPTDPDRLEPADGPEPGDARRLGAGTVLGEALGGGRLWE